jgi:hypothetical protein
MVGMVGCPCWVDFWFFHVAMSRTRGVLPPLGESVFFLFGFIHFGIGFVGLLS